MFHTGGDCVACQPLLFPTKPETLAGNSFADSFAGTTEVFKLRAALLEAAKTSRFLAVGSFLLRGDVRTRFSPFWNTTVHWHFKIFCSLQKLIEIKRAKPLDPLFCLQQLKQRELAWPY